MESYLITPQVLQDAVSLPQALTILEQRLFEVPFGIPALVLATPLATGSLHLGTRFCGEGCLDGK